MTTNPLSPDELVERVEDLLRRAFDICIEDGEGAIDVAGLAQLIMETVEARAAIAAMPELTGLQQRVKQLEEALDSCRFWFAGYVANDGKGADEELELTRSLLSDKGMDK